MGLAGVWVAFMMSQEKEAVSGLFFFFFLSVRDLRDKLCDIWIQTILAGVASIELLTINSCRFMT